MIITKQDVLDALDPVIEALGTYDITTIRASLCRKKKSVLLTKRAETPLCPDFDAL